MMMTDMDIETSVYYVHLMWLIAREDFIKFLSYILYFSGNGEKYEYMKQYIRYL
jgi:hypothetical protein